MATRERIRIDMGNIETTEHTLYTVGTGKLLVVTSIVMVNRDSNSRTATWRVGHGGASYYVLQEAVAAGVSSLHPYVGWTLPAGDTLKVGTPAVNAGTFWFEANGVLYTLP